MTTNPNHEITIEPAPKRVTVEFNGETIADSTKTLVLKETGYADVHYFPRADVGMDYLKSTDHHSHCPYKGDAAYWSVEVGGETVENAVWSYEAPFDGVLDIEGYLSFYPDRVTVLGA